MDYKGAKNKINSFEKGDEEIKLCCYPIVGTYRQLSSIEKKLTSAAFLTTQTRGQRLFIITTLSSTSLLDIAFSLLATA